MTTSSAFGENVDRLGSIRSILDNYPFSAGLLREILQNSDDAKATAQVRHLAFMLIDSDAEISLNDRPSYWTVESTHLRGSMTHVLPILKDQHCSLSTTQSFFRTTGSLFRISVNPPKGRIHRECEHGFLDTVV
jgi:hypothetical protein